MESFIDLEKPLDVAAVECESVVGQGIEENLPVALFGDPVVQDSENAAVAAHRILTFVRAESDVRDALVVVARAIVEVGVGAVTP